MVGFTKIRTDLRGVEFPNESNQSIRKLLVETSGEARK
jgi:hypothetical protein